MTAPPAPLPALPYEDWEPTKQTLHLWAQIVGKHKLVLAHRRNHWWHAALHVSVHGLTTRRMPAGGVQLEVELDLVDHRLRARTPEREVGFELADGVSVAAFHAQLADALAGLGIEAAIRPEPFGIPVTTPFPEDSEHASYDRDAVGRFLRVLQWSSDVLEEYAGWSTVKTSPVHVYWHSFDLAVARFSGRPAPEIPGADPVTADAYSHEVVSCGFWAGDDERPFPAYYSYTAPEPEGLRNHELRPAGARWIEQGEGSLALLPYDEVRTADDPAATLLAFLQSTYEAGARSAGWDLAGTATAWAPAPGRG